MSQFYGFCERVVYAIGAKMAANWCWNCVSCLQDSQALKMDSSSPGLQKQIAFAFIRPSYSAVEGTLCAEEILLPCVHGFFPDNRDHARMVKLHASVVFGVPSPRMFCRSIFVGGQPMNFG